MYKEYLIVATNKEGDTRIYWDSSVAEVQTDIVLLRKAGYEVEYAHHLKVDQVYDFTESKFLSV
jgi:hypothetical protein